MTTIETITHIKCSCGQLGTLTLHELGEKYLRRTCKYSVAGLNWVNRTEDDMEVLEDDVTFDELKLYCPECGDRITAQHVVDFEL